LHRQRLQSVGFEYSQGVTAMEEAQGVKEMKRHHKPHQDPDEPPECGKQGEAAADRLENYVKRREEHDHSYAVKEIADDADAKEPFVRQDIPSGFGVTISNQTVVDAKIDVDHGDEREKVRKAGDFGGGLLIGRYALGECGCAHRAFSLGEPSKQVHAGLVRSASARKDEYRIGRKHPIGWSVSDSFSHLPLLV
jgi:hypothetical protein